MKKILSLFVALSVLVGCTKNEPIPTPTISPVVDMNAIPYIMPLGGAAMYENLPTSHDLSDKMPPVENQGNSNACTTWAAGYYLMGYTMKLQGGEAYSFYLPSGEVDQTKTMSPGYLFSQVSTDGNGASVPAVLNVLQNRGVCNYALLPNQQHDNKLTAEMHNDAAKHKIQKWGRLMVGGTRADAVKYFISKGYPVAAEIVADPSFQTIKAGDIWSATGTEGIRHAILLVGYDDTKGAIKFVNSFGTDYGDNGYGWMDYSVLAKSNFCAAYVAFAANQNIEQGENATLELVNANNVTFTKSPLIGQYTNSSEFSIKNSGTDVLFIESVEGSPYFSIESTTEITEIATLLYFVEPNTTHRMMLRFTPLEAGTFGGALRFKSNSSAASPTINVTASARKLYSFTICGDMNFGAVTVGSSQERILRVYNDSEQGMKQTSIEQVDGFTITPVNSYNIAAGSYKEYRVTFTPKYRKNYTAYGKINIAFENTAGQIEGNSAFKLTGTGK